uniref:Retrovirus-related Pol polyprotein from transposon TNT 1-94 n=1 Tax=Bactrocera latifrons TaxID=174628 RepID=A0A0K8WLZ8_BACLA
MKWHSRYGHINFASLLLLNEKQMVRGMKVRVPQEICCTVCMSSKCTQKPYSSTERRSAEMLGSKDEVFNKFKEYKKMAECQSGKKLEVLRSDNGTEFLNNSFDNFLKENGIIRQLTVPYTPQQNGLCRKVQSNAS